MFTAILIAAVIVIIAAVVLLSRRADKKRQASHHIGLPELGSLTRAGEDTQVAVRRARAEQSEPSSQEHAS
jgi:Flp pilus assembly protein TadB